MTGLSLVISLSYECLGTLLISQHRSRYSRRVTNRYLNQCWSRSMSPYGVVKPQWVNFLASVRCGNNVKICIFKLIIRNTSMGIESNLILSYLITQGIMRTFQRCVARHSADFHKCCYAAAIERRERHRWYQYRDHPGQHWARDWRCG